VEPATIERLLGLVATAGHLTSVPPRVGLVSGVKRTRRVLTSMVGSYGLIQNPPHLLVGVMPEESDLARLDLGYVLEQVVLEATRLGLSTCWVSGMFDAQRAGDAVGLASREVAAAVIALGYPAEDRLGRLRSRTVRRAFGGHRRKPLTEIVFSDRWGKPWSPHGAGGSTELAEVPTLVAALEHARLAPSGANSQPWRFIVRPGYVALALVPPRPIEVGIAERVSPLFGVEPQAMVHAKPIDAGIVMAHFALASAALGREGRWEVRLGDDTLAREWGLPQGVIPVATFR